MDARRFDTLARALGHPTSRRGALGVLVGAVARLGEAVPSLARSRAHNGKAKVNPCSPGGTACTPGKGRNSSGCDFAGSTAFFQRDVRGSNLSHANFTGAQLAQADLRGANLSGACLVGANLLEAKLGSSVNLHGAVFCGTLMPDGSINDDDCGHGTACCPTGCEDGACGDSCVGFNQICSVLSPVRCCGDTSCTPSILLAVTSCQFSCLSDLHCNLTFPHLDLVCEASPGACPFFRRCCRPTACTTDADCPRSGRCCDAGEGEKRCCT